MYFAFPHTLRCCETECRDSYGDATWTSRRQSLVRHLEQEHAIRITTGCNKCSLCGEEFSLHPSGQAYFANGSMEAPNTLARHQCAHCVASLPSARDLANHTHWHAKQDAMVRQASPRASPALALPAASSDVQASPSEEQQASPFRSLRPSVPDPSSGEHPTPPSTDTLLPPLPDTPGSATGEVPGPTDSAARDLDQIAPDDVDDGPPSTDISDTGSLLPDQSSTLRSLTREPLAPEGRERAVQVCCEAMGIVVTTVKLPPVLCFILSRHGGQPVTHGNELRSLERSKPSGSFQPVFRKKLIVFLADGLRWDYVDRADYPGFRLLEKLGVRAERLLPVFPSVSYPNWYSLATGLYTEDHGILGNYMYDAKTNSYFTMSSPESFHPRWWTRAEPLWTRALRRNRTVAMFWWDGCQVSINGTRPQSCTPYGGYSTEIDHLMNQRIGEAVNAFKTGRLDLAMFYYEGPDAEGHRNGPDSEGIEDAVRKVDRYLWNLQMGLQREGLLEEVNIVVVSDHGMTRTSPESTHHIDMDALVNERDVHIMLDKGPFAMLHPKPGREHEVLKSLLMKKPKGLNVFTKDNIPDEWHFRNNELVAPIVLLAQEAIHAGIGGPSLIRMVDVYNLMCYMLGMDPAPNSGSWKHVMRFVFNDDDLGPVRVFSCGDHTVLVSVAPFSETSL
ncbi:hypothetical protein HPB49_009974 [Dermacentor silvarum]|uniref:Uncharacterized protein n=1 Tax=Dermacentor silvarum TaxID=543639 RepID=A0ACB8C8S5_DERSI|nr:hypothetical protein HPB49_009974 [Dermacentor silvarum]